MNTTLVRILLAKNNLKAIDLAHAIGVSHASLSLWMNHRYPVPQAYQHRLANALGISIGSLFGSEAVTLVIDPSGSDGSA